MKFVCASGLLVMVSAAALANQQAAADCAAKLPANAAAIYSASAPQISPGADIRAIVTSVTRGMVKSGSLARSGARPAAEAAGACLKLQKE